jgi:Concanavalin A-like lectin/glucanases superfamily/F5/8 type C domain
MSRTSVYLLCVCLMLGMVGSAAAGDPTLVGWWKFNEGAGTTAQDSSDYGNDGTFNGAPQWVDGYLGGALEFDGSDDSLDCGSDPSLDLTTWTIAFWLNANENKNYNGFVIKGADAAENYEVLGFGDGSFHFPITFDDGSRTWPNSPTGVIVAGEWAHFAYSYDSAEGRRLYKDGSLVFEDAESGTPQASTVPLTIGNEGGLSRFVNGVMDDTRIYNRVLTAEELADVILGKGPSSELADGPSPENEATDVPRDTILGWEAGEFAVTHDVYLGTVFSDVNEASRANPMDVLVSQGQATATYDPPAVLQFGQTYYWRVDEVNAAPDNTIFKGELWSFTVEPLAYPVEGVTATSNGVSEAGTGAENTVNGSGLNVNDEHSTAAADMWLAVPGAEPLQIQYEFPSVLKLHEMRVWNYNVQFEMMLGFGVKDVTVEYSEDGENWVVLGDATLDRGTAMATYTANTTIDFGGVAARHVRLTVNSGYGMLGQFGLGEVRFLSIPVQAREPEPEDGTADVALDADLIWRAGRQAVSHEIYLSTDEAAVADDSALIDATEATTVDPGALDLATTYYWKVNEVNEAEAISVWEGIVWSFATQDYLVVDDFESYNDEDNVIYETWVDGWVNETGSTVGYLSAPFAEQTIVNSGSQSMPLSYDNAGVATSETDLALAQNWTASGIQSLSLYFYGDPGNSGGQLYVKINGTKIAYDGSAVNLTRATWQLWNIDLAASGASLSNVSSLTIGIEGTGATGIVYIDDIRLYPEILDYHKFPDVTAAGDAVVGVPNDGDWPDAESPDLAIDDDTATKFLHRQGGAMATGIQVTPAAGATVVTGLTFTTANDTPARDPITFELSGSNAGIGGPYELIASGDIVDFAGATEWPRFTKNATVIAFDNDVAYAHYQIVFPTLRGESETLMQIAEIELIGETP